MSETVGAEKHPQWIPLADLRAGAIFETQDGWRAVKGVLIRWGDLHCTSLENGIGVYERSQTLVREIIVKDSE